MPTVTSGGRVELLVDNEKIETEVVEKIVEIDHVEERLNLNVEARPVLFKHSEVGAPGPQGRTGDQGTQGPRGDTGPPGGTLDIPQAVPASTWTINHGLGVYPAITVTDSAGTVVEGEIDYVSSNTVVVTFSNAFGGIAHLVY